MIKIENVDVFGWEAAIRGMRNPMNSWNKGDTNWQKYYSSKDINRCIGDNDLKLMKSLSKAGNDHAKFLRMINVTLDITAPLYWWKEADTYRVGKEQNSCSTMHKIHAKEFALDDFSHEHLQISAMEVFVEVIYWLNEYRDRYLTSKDKDDWWQMIQLLPSSYNQKRTVQLNYAVLKNMYFSRRNHKLDEWKTFCDWCEKLPYFKEICVEVYNAE